MGRPSFGTPKLNTHDGDDPAWLSPPSSHPPPQKKKCPRRSLSLPLPPRSAPKSCPRKVSGLQRGERATRSNNYCLYVKLSSIVMSRVDPQRPLLAHRRSFPRRIFSVPVSSLPPLCYLLPLISSRSLVVPAAFLPRRPAPGTTWEREGKVGQAGDLSECRSTSECRSRSKRGAFD